MYDAGVKGWDWENSGDIGFTMIAPIEQAINQVVFVVMTSDYNYEKRFLSIITEAGKGSSQ